MGATATAALAACCSAVPWQAGVALGAVNRASCRTSSTMLQCPVPLAAAALSDTGARAEGALLTAACADTPCARPARSTRGAAPWAQPLDPYILVCTHSSLAAIKTVPKSVKSARRHGVPRSGLWRPELLAIAHTSYLYTNRTHMAAVPQTGTCKTCSRTTTHSPMGLETRLPTRVRDIYALTGDLPQVACAAWSARSKRHGGAMPW